MIKTKSQATSLGCLAIVLWSTDTIINLQLVRLPIFQVLASVWMICFLIYVVVISIRKGWSKVKQKPIIWLMGAGGICGAHAAAISALRFAPPEHVSTLSVSWPIFVVAFGGWILNEDKCWRQFLSSVIGFIGVGIVITDGKLLAGFNLEYSQGYLLAIFSFVLWSTYVLMNRRLTHVNSFMIGMYLGVGGLLAFSYHFSFNTYIEPTLLEWLLLMLGGSILAVSYYCWDFAIKKGHFALLNILSYFNPIVTVSLLMIFGMSPAKFSVCSGAMIVVVSALLCAGNLKKPNKKEKVSIFLEEQ